MGPRWIEQNDASLATFNWPQSTDAQSSSLGFVDPGDAQASHDDLHS